MAQVEQYSKVVALSELLNTISTLPAGEVESLIRFAQLSNFVF